MNSKTGAVLVLSGPSGAGKSSLINKIFKEIGECYFFIFTTTRSIRAGEKDNVDYHFVSEDEFKREIESDNFLEYAIVHGNYYGTSLKPVKEALSKGKLVIFDIDVQGNTAVKNRLGDITTSVFITPPTISELKKRLINRSTDSEDVIYRRLKMAKKEIQRISEYEFLIINDELEKAAKELKFVAMAARLKKPSEEINMFVQEWEDG